MTISLDLILWGAGLVIGWTAFLAGVVRAFLHRWANGLDASLSAIRNAQKEEAREWQRIERDLVALRLELPTNYVRREDYVQNQTVIMARLDALNSKLELVRIETLSSKINATHAEGAKK